MTARIPPGHRKDIGTVNALVAHAMGLVAGTKPPHVFTTIARNRRLFRRWLFFAAALMPGGRLPRADTELLILRTAQVTGCDYEWQHHAKLGRVAGLSAEDLERVKAGPGAPGWTTRQRVLLQAAQELLDDRRIGDATWAELSSHLSEPDLIEFCLLVGHYEMLAMTLNSLRIELDPPGMTLPLVRRFMK
jgi:AhpD family alkylhydroperoxidase